MYMAVIDGIAVFATHFIRCNLKGVREELAPFQLEKEGIVVYGNLTEVEAKLVELNIPYTVESLDYEAHKPKAQGIKYASRTEAIEHLLYGKEPQSLIIPNLRKRLTEKEAEIAELKKELGLIKGRLNKGGL